MITQLTEIQTIEFLLITLIIIVIFRLIRLNNFFYYFNPIKRLREVQTRLGELEQQAFEQRMEMNDLKKELSKAKKQKK